MLIVFILNPLDVSYDDSVTQPAGAEETASKDGHFVIEADTSYSN